ncbi:SdrD B-like domain-containing protein [Leucobacter tardus]|uniref:SD-repeat containing protein B domain-containing protein n=1 Tax=Leucobacter tardus TaxID=501483 RepID=A0A939TQ73_9MICO|nr:SdrD B-like domain-containing protein [Leucobacter tardus]MBO2988647.1 hypothetical protein [Leucobacter tardus]
MEAMTLRARQSGRRLLTIGAAAAIVSAGLVQVAPAQAAPSDGYPDWSISGGSGAFTGDLEFPVGFPEVTFATDTLASGTMIPGGGSTWLPESTSFGAEFGSSRNQEYISVRPAGNRAGAPSTTTYTFSSPSPVGTWGFSLGDVDAEILGVTATDADGNPVSGEQLGLVETFNYCGQAGGPSCDQSQAFALPTSTISETGVALEELGCPTSQDLCDTAGASAWFSPTVPLKTLSITSEWKSGFPSYQTWFSTRAQSVGGAVAADCALDGSAAVQLLDAAGAVVATAPVDGQGAYVFPVVAGGTGYSVRVDPSTLPTGATSTAVPVEVARDDVAGVDLAVTSTFSVTGTVAGDVDLGGVPVTLTPADDAVPARSTTTGASGDYGFAEVSNGEYILTVETGEGVDVTPQQQRITVDCAVPEVSSFVLTVTEDPGQDPDPDPDPNDPEPPPPSEDPTNPSPPPGGDGSVTPTGSESGALAATGAASAPVALMTAGAAAILLGMMALLTAKARRRSQRL